MASSEIDIREFFSSARNAGFIVEIKYIDGILRLWKMRPGTTTMRIAAELHFNELADVSFQHAVRAAYALMRSG